MTPPPEFWSSLSDFIAQLPWLLVKLWVIAGCFDVVGSWLMRDRSKR